MKEKGNLLDSITFAGNGEPSVHPDFSLIVDDVILLRNKYYKTAKTTLLSNAGLLSTGKKRYEMRLIKDFGLKTFTF